MASIKNIVTVVILQVVVIVAGVLAAGIFHKESLIFKAAMPWPTALLYTYGFAAFLFPLVWGTGAVTLQLRVNVSDDVRALVFWLGVLGLIGLAIFCVYADVTPWLHLIQNVSGNDTADGP